MRRHLNQEKEKERYDDTEQATDLLLNTPTTENLIKAQRDKYASPSIIPVTRNLNFCFVVALSMIKYAVRNFSARCP